MKQTSVFLVAFALVALSGGIAAVPIPCCGPNDPPPLQNRPPTHIGLAPITEQPPQLHLTIPPPPLDSPTSSPGRLDTSILAPPFSATSDARLQNEARFSYQPPNKPSDSIQQRPPSKALPRRPESKALPRRPESRALPSIPINRSSRQIVPNWGVTPLPTSPPSVKGKGKEK